MTDLSLARHIGAILARRPAPTSTRSRRRVVEALDALIAAKARRARLPAAPRSRPRARGARAAARTRHALPQHDPAREQPPYRATSRSSSASRRWCAGTRSRWWCARTARAVAELGGHIASYASAAEIFEVGFNHFFRARATQGGDLVYFQPHSAPGVYARAFLEGRLSGRRPRALSPGAVAQGKGGLSSYPHPWLMPDFWQFPTGSMGLGPITAIYQARFMRYLRASRPARRATARAAQGVGLLRRRRDGRARVARRAVARGARAARQPDLRRQLQPAAARRPGARQRPIIQELEGLFAGAGWNVIKLLWGSDWDPLFARDHDTR